MPVRSSRAVARRSWRRLSSRSSPPSAQRDVWRRCVVLFAICDAQARCLARRLGGAFSASPLVLALACAAFAALPAVALWAGRRAAPSLHSADPKLLLLSAGMTAALAGAAVTLAVRGAAVLGRQLEPAPVPRVVAVAGLVLFPASLALGAAAPAAILFAAPVEGWRTPLACARLLGFAALGGAGAEALL